jgi:predicted CXXCH cytochrome family protein
MFTKKRMRNASGSAAALWLLSGVLVGFAPMAVIAPAGEVLQAGERMCEFSLQLQSSAAVRKEYLAKVIEVTGRRDVAGSADSGEASTVAYAANAAGNDGEEGGRDLWGVSFKDSKRRSAGVDEMSKGCLMCHDGVAASPITTNFRNDPFRRGSRVNSFGGDHPIGMDYNRYVSVNSGYKRIPSGTKMILVDGKVGCLTCHNPLNPEKGHLVMSDRYSALCRTCHNK